MMSIKIGYGTLVLILSIVFAAHAKVVDLNEDNWHAVLEKEWMIEL